METTQNNETKNSNSGKVSVKVETKKQLEIEIKKIKRIEPNLNLKPEQLINYLLGLLDDQHREKIVKNSLTWDIEGPRLRTLWSKKHRKTVSKKEWESMLYSGKLKEFIEQNSRI